MKNRGEPLSASIIIRNKNESVYLKSVLKALSIQDVPGVDVIVVDNASTDASVAIAKGFGARVVPIAESDFSYGRALNLGLEVASNEVCIILSAHSLPLGANFVRECLRPFADQRVAAARCTYVGKSADLVRWMNPEVLDENSDYLSKGPLASGCVIRKSVWEQFRFDEDVAAAEDKLWAAKVLQEGYAIYSPCAAFYVYMKKLSPALLLKRNYLEVHEVYRKSGLLTGFAKTTFPLALRDLALGLFLRAPRAGLRVAASEALKIYYRYSLH